MAPDGRSGLARPTRMRTVFARHWRAALPFVLWLAVPTLVGVNWYGHLSCGTLANSRPCLPTGGPLGVIVRMLAGVVGFAWAGGAYWLFRGSVERVANRPLGRLLFAPDDRTVVAVAALAAVTAVLARPLLGGHVTAHRGLWLLLAVPYYPVLVGSAVVGGALFLVGPAIVAVIDLPPVLQLLVAFSPVVFALLVFVVTLAVNVVWLYLLARAGHAGVAGVVTRVRRWRTRLE